MKNYLFIIMAAIILASCGNEENLPVEPLKPEPPEVPTEQEYIQVPIGFAGEITSITTEPFARADEAKDNYVFQVYAKPDNEEYASYKYYAYGFFDNKEDMIINLKTGYKYKFDVSMVVDGSERVYHYSLNSSGWADVSNTFYISSTEYVRFMYEGYIYLRNPRETFSRPNIDRFYGEATDYVPVEGGTVQINMKRVSFGVKLIAKDFNSGKVEVCIEDAPIITMNSADGNTAQDIISFKNLSGGYKAPDTYFENIPVNIVWIKPDGARVPVASKKVEFTRSDWTTIEFTIKENSTGNNFDLNANENMGDGGKVILDNEDGTDTGVDPKP